MIIAAKINVLKTIEWNKFPLFLALTNTPSGYFKSQACGTDTMIIYTLDITPVFSCNILGQRKSCTPIKKFLVLAYCFHIAPEFSSCTDRHGYGFVSAWRFMLVLSVVRISLGRVRWDSSDFVVFTCTCIFTYTTQNTRLVP